MPPVSQFMKRFLRRFDVELTRRSRLPEVTLLGLVNLPIRTIIDAGANLGQFARQMRRHFPDAHLWCFEPLSGPFAALRAWADAEPGKVTAVNCALGDAEGEVEMREHVDHPASSSFLPATELSRTYYPESKRETAARVRVVTLDRAVAEFGIRLDSDVLIKMDVQGFEDRVIRGGRDTFAKARACVVEVCLDELYRGQATFPAILGLLSDSGFRYAGNLEQSYAQDGHVIFVDAVFVRS
jgi:FkbM family methyltransferase